MKKYMDGKYFLKLTECREVAKETMEFRFEKPANFSYQAGQHLDWAELNPRETDAEGNGRSFTLSSAPYENFLAFSTRMRDTAFKRNLKTMPFGTQLEATGPEGHFILPATSSSSPFVFLAGGIGITPFRSISLQASHDKLASKIFLFYSNRTPQDAAYLEELQNLETQNPNFKLIATMTQDPSWSGEKGYIDKKMLTRYLSNLVSPLYFLAGPPQMVAALRQTLNEAKVPPQNILTEQFTGY